MAKSTANRGLKFEARIQNKCEWLRQQGIALIEKIPTDFKIIRNGTRIVSAFPVAKTRTCDFLGVIQGKAISIEAKETQNKTSFPFSNIKEHQIIYQELFSGLGGLSYYLIHFSTLKEVWLVPNHVMRYWRNNLNRKSIPHDEFINNKECCLLDYEDLNFHTYITGEINILNYN